MPMDDAFNQVKLYTVWNSDSMCIVPTCIPLTNTSFMIRQQITSIFPPSDMQSSVEHPPRVASVYEAFVEGRSLMFKSTITAAYASDP